MTPQAVYNLVSEYANKLGFEDLAAHDLRRTYAQLGHSSVATTQRYLNLELNLESTISDFIPLD